MTPILMLLAASLATAQDLGVWDGSVYTDLDDGLQLDVSETVGSLDEIGANLTFIEVAVTGDAKAGFTVDMDDVAAYLDHIAESPLSGVQVVAILKSANDLGLDVAAWNDAVDAQIMALSELTGSDGGAYLVGATFHELHSDMCSVIKDSACLEASEVGHITARIEALGLEHLVYLPADHRTLMHLDDTLVLGEQAQWTAGNTWSLSWHLPTPGLTGSPMVTVGFDFAHGNSNDAHRLDLVYTTEDGSELTVWSSGSFDGVLQRVQPVSVRFAQPTCAGVPCAGTVRLRSVIEDDAADGRNLHVYVSRPQVTLHAMGRPPVSLPLDPSTTFTNETTSTLQDHTWTTEYKLRPGAVLSVIAGSDATYDRVLADTPEAAATSFEWMNRVLPPSVRRYAMVRGVNRSNWAPSGWYTWEEGSFAKVLSALRRARVDGVVVYKAPVALMRPEAGVFSEKDKRASGFLEMTMTNTDVDLHGLYAGFDAVLEEEVTGLYLWSNGDAGDGNRTVIEACDADGACTVLFDDYLGDRMEQTLTTPVDCSGGICDRPSVAVTLDEPLGVGSTLAVRTTLETGEGGASAVRLQPVCAAEPNGLCTLSEDAGWTFVSGVAAVLEDARVGEYVQDILDAMKSF